MVKQTHDGWCRDLFRNFGADVWDETGEKIILQEQKSAEATRALNFIKEGWDMGLFPDDAASWDYAANNKAYQEEQSIKAPRAEWRGDPTTDESKIAGIQIKFIML